MVQKRMDEVPVVALASMPPPPETAVLPLTVQLVKLSVPPVLKVPTAPPSAARLPVKVQVVKAALPSARKTAPPRLVPASPLLSVRALTFRVARVRPPVTRKKRKAV